MTSPFPPFAWKTLRQPLQANERREIVAGVTRLLGSEIPSGPEGPVRSAPDATPFVSLYAEGSLRGCYGSSEGDSAARLIGAFLRAKNDQRFGGVPVAGEGNLVAQVSYLRGARLVNPELAEEEIEPGTHGVAFVSDRAAPVLLLPHVARDDHMGAGDLLRALARKAGRSWGDDSGGGLYLFEAEDVVVRPRDAEYLFQAEDVVRPRDPEARAVRDFAARTGLAAAWLASLVAPDGSVTFAIDPRARRRVETGEMHHGRAAVAVQALAAAGSHPALVARARERLGADIHRGLGGASLEGWPSDRAAVAGTLALAVLAGVPVKQELVSMVAGSGWREVGRTPWHAAQVATALGAETPMDLWQACVADLERRPWAPWTMLAAVARRDRAVRTRTARTIASALRPAAPHRGGASVTPTPEVALTSLAVEALAGHPAAWARAAVLRGRDFLASMQLMGSRLYGALDPALARGAFPASPIADVLRADVTAHALLALLAARDALGSSEDP